ncbi:MAG: hypothetical protein COT26_01170 [Candidatus Kerfeldbacteria bacterium CG08_land_8_20_14_0_20_43_14]|uniref:Radical SAM core domain-containing protein n=1 Tax=Candidatus Kerfeldbacteria bacterium CG08_land_8_20_14_0_20_43_14 TaxID=2014246 RepID=A0A2H0YQS2_9BACT|nr:MAG: hypothetical protein COT26_01170 [Candidatus Kerfeldbacteria bacterium CG08_land_8_20_14_0_20_43_14]
MLEIKDRYDPKKVFIHREKIESLMHSGIPTPVCFEIDPADGFCNQSCVDCSYASNRWNPLRLIDRKLLLKTLPDLVSCKVKSVEWVGGSEPLLHPDISLFIKVAKECGLRCGIVTNGSMLPKIYKNILARDMDYVRISLDAATPEVYFATHGSRQFAKVIAQLQEIINQGADPSLFGASFRIMGANICDIFSASKMMSEIGAAYIQYKYSLTDDNTEYLKGSDDLINREIEKAKQLNSATFSVLGGDTLKDITDVGIANYAGCISSSLVGVITAAGDIPFCIRFRNVPSMYIGNIRDGLTNVWGGARHQAILSTVSSKRCGYICKHHKYNRIILRHCKGNHCQEVMIKKGVVVNPEFI